MHLSGCRASRLLVSCALFLSSCAFATAPRRVPFNEAEFAAYRGVGSGTVTGQLIVTSPDGETHIGNSEHVTLIPVTAYTREMVDREIGDGENLAPSDSRFRPYVRLTTVDSHGNFVFDHIRPGEYFVSGLAEWYLGDDAQYQWACERITVGHGRTVRLKLSKNIHRPGRPTLVIWALQ